MCFMPTRNLRLWEREMSLVGFLDFVNTDRERFCMIFLALSENENISGLLVELKFYHDASFSIDKLI